MAILVNGWILPIGGALSGRVCVCSLHSRLVFGRPQVEASLRDGLIISISLLRAQVGDNELKDQLGSDLIPPSAYKINTNL